MTRLSGSSVDPDSLRLVCLEGGHPESVNQDLDGAGGDVGRRELVTAQHIGGCIGSDPTTLTDVEMLVAVEQ